MSIRSFEPWYQIWSSFYHPKWNYSKSSPRIPVTSIVQHFPIALNNTSLAFLLSVQLTPDIKMSINRHRYNTDINMSMPYIVSICGFVILGLLILPTTSHVLCLLLLLSWKHTAASNVFAVHEPNSRPFGCELSNLRKEKQNKTIYWVLGITCTYCSYLKQHTRRGSFWKPF